MEKQETNTDHITMDRSSRSLRQPIIHFTKYLKDCVFLWYSIALSIIGWIWGYDKLLQHFSSTPISIVVGIALTLIGLWLVRQDLLNYKKKHGKITIQRAIVIGVFVYMCLAFDAVDYTISLLYIASEGSGVPQMQENARVFREKMDLVGIFALFPYPIFFYGNDIWRWIRKRDLVYPIIS